MPCNGKSIELQRNNCAFALVGRVYSIPYKPWVLPWAMCTLGLQPAPLSGYLVLKKYFFSGVYKNKTHQ